MDIEDRKYSLAELQKYSYRILQQIAKSMSLPSNVKKIYLIQMIYAKKFKSEVELDDIVLKVKRERQQMSQAKKKVTRKRSYLQGPEISSTSTSNSPPISLTPKRPGHIVIHCSPQNIRQALAKYNAKHNYLTRNSTAGRKTFQSPKKSDRILRSFNIKSTKKVVNDTKMMDTIDTSPKNYFKGSTVSSNGFSNVNNSVFSVFRPQNVNKEMQEPRISNISEHCMLKKYVPVVSRNTFGLDPERNQLIPLKRNAATNPMTPAKRHRVLSGIDPIVPKEPPKVCYEYLHNVGFRRQDGKIAKINALVQKRMEPVQDIEVTVQDIINCSISQTFSNPEYVNAKKIREEVRSPRSFQREVPRDMEERLPKINAVFSRFNAHTDFTQPIYVQVSDESERFQQYPIFMGRSSNTNLLESLYNFRSPFLVNQPLPHIPTTTNTRCVYSTPVIATAVAQRSTALAPDYTAPSYERDNSYYKDLSAFPRIRELLQYGEQQGHLRRGFRCDEELSTSCSSLDDTASQDLGATVTIPEMVEDALELISQDGDYMERIGMDVRVQCVLCSVVSPKFLLEYHLRKEHASDILVQESSSWSISCALRWLRCARPVRVVSHEGALLVLSAALRARRLHAALHTLTLDTNLPKSGSITVYNKLTGEPHSWHGEIQPLPHHLPYENDTEGLKVPISELDLLPNSANLTLLNEELVSESPTKVVFGQPDLNDIHITLFVKIFN